MDYKEYLVSYLSSCSGKVRDIVFELLDYIESLPQELQVPALQFLCDNIFDTRSDYSKPVKSHYTDEQAAKSQSKITVKFLQELENLIKSSVMQNSSAIDFYKEAWNEIHTSKFRVKRDRALALFALLNQDLIPYRKVGVGLSVTEEAYHNITENLSNNILADAKFILKMDYEQKTQASSLLVDRLLTLKTPEEQAVYMAQILNFVEHSLRMKIKNVVDE